MNAKPNREAIAAILQRAKDKASGHPPTMPTAGSPDDGPAQVIEDALKATETDLSGAEIPDFKTRLRAAMIGIEHGVGSPQKCVEALRECTGATMIRHGTVLPDHNTRYKAAAFALKLLRPNVPTIQIQ